MTSSTRTGRPVARGLVNFDAVELPGLLGRSTVDLGVELGPAYEKESSTATTWSCCWEGSVNTEVGS